MAWGDLYTQALNSWNAIPLDQRLKGAGYTLNTGGDSPQWWSPDGQQYASDPNQFASAAGFDKQKFFSGLGIMPVDPKWTDNGSGGSTPESVQAYQDNAARSFNQFGFNFQNYEDMLRHTTGAGQMVDDPTLGKVWVPQNRNSQTWNNDYMSASARQGSGIDKAVNGFMDSGGLVKALGGAVLGAGAGDIFNGGLDSWGNVLSGGADVPYDVGQNLANNPEVFGNSNAVGSSFTDQITNWLTKQATSPGNLAKLFGGFDGGGTGSGGSGGTGTNTGGNSMATSTDSSLLDSILGLGSKTLPSLLAWNYFQNLPKPDTAQYQTLINKAGDMSGPLGQYDLNTATGRGTLNSSLASRGVSGSSFGDQSLANYDTQRDLGRGSLGFGGLATQGSLLNNMNSTIVGNNKNSTDFLGRLLGGTGSAIGSNTAGASTGSDLSNILQKAFPDMFGGSSGTNLAGPAINLLQGASGSDWLSSLFGGGSTTPTNFADPFGVNQGLNLGTSGFGTNNPLADWLGGGNGSGMANLSNLWGW